MDTENTKKLLKELHNINNNLEKICVALLAVSTIGEYTPVITEYLDYQDVITPSEDFSKLLTFFDFNKKWDKNVEKGEIN